MQKSRQAFEQWWGIFLIGSRVSPSSEAKAAAWEAWKYLTNVSPQAELSAADEQAQSNRFRS